MIVYLIRHCASGLGYVGRTRQSLLARWAAHCEAAPYRSDMPISRAIFTYGPAAFDIEQLESFDDEDAWRLGEAVWTKRLGTQVPHGFNVKAGDEWTAELRTKVSASLTGRVITWGDKIAANNGQRGKPPNAAQAAALAAGRAIGPSREVLSARNSHRKLSDDDVREIRRLAAAGNLSQREIGERFGMTQSGISKIIRRVALAHVLDAGEHMRTDED